MTQYDENLVLADVECLTPEKVIEIIPPYIDGMSDQQKLESLKPSLRRAIKTRQRKLALINAYYLGKLFEEMPSGKDKETLRSSITDHYYVMGRSTYDLFEGFPEQIYRTSYLMVQIIRKMHRPRVLRYRQKLLEHFVGTQSLVGEDCHGEDHETVE